MKKLISMATAVLMMASGISLVGATAANATAPVIASTSTITSGQVNPTIVITSTSTFRAAPSHTNANFSIGNGGGTMLTYTGISLSGNSITISLTGTARHGTLVLTASGAAFDPNPGAEATLQFVVAKVPATDGALTFQGGGTQGPTANGSAPNFMNGGSGQWNANSTITWSPTLTSNRFAAGVVYTATVTLNPSDGTFESLSSSFFTFAGATSVSATYSGSPRTSATVSVVFPATAGGSSSSSSSSSSTGASASEAGFAQAQAAQHIQLMRVQAARTTLLLGLTATKPGTLADYANAELDIKSEAALARVNAKVLALPVAKRSSTDEIAKIIKLENFVDSVPSSDIHPGTIASQLVSNGFISADNRLKLSLANALRSRPASSIDSVEEIKAAIVEETARLQERVKRTAEIKAKIAARKK